MIEGNSSLLVAISMESLRRQTKNPTNCVPMLKRKLKEKKKAQNDDSWWGWVEKAKNVISEALQKIADFLSTLYKKVQEQINKVIDSVRTYQEPHRSGNHLDQRSTRYI